MRIVSIMAVHNRRALTVRCVAQLLAEQAAGLDLRIVVVDDGSTDGTGDAVRAMDPAIRVLEADGSLFWGGGMRLAEACALELEGIDALLWVNDDVDLDTGAVRRLVACAQQQGSPTIVVGALRDPETSRTTYSGWKRRSDRLGLVMDQLEPSGTSQSIDAFNGNLVLVPRAIAATLGGLDPAFTHHYGDLDYGLRARAAGYRVLLAPGTFGATARNSPRGTFRDPSLPRSGRLRLLVSPKGFPPAEKLGFLRRHGALGWPVQWAGWYALHVGRILARR